MNGSNDSDVASTRRNIAAGIDDVARDLADGEYQERVWIRASDPSLQSSYEEAVAALLDDYDVDEVLKNPDAYGLQPERAHALRDLVEELKKFHADVRPQSSTDAVRSPRWRAVQDAARRFIE